MLKPEDISAIFEWIELLLIANLKRNLARHKDEEEQEGFTWTAWQAEKLRNLNIFRRQCSAIMDRYKDQIDDETRQLLEEQFEEGVNGAIKELEEAHAQAEAPQLPDVQSEEQPSTEPETMTAPEPVTFQVPAAETQQKPTSEPETAAPDEPAPEITVETIIEDMAPEEPLVTVTVNPEPQFFGVDKAKTEKLIEDVTQLEEQVETAALRMTDDVYRQTVNRVQLAMATGSITYEKAVDMAVADFLNQGINCIEYSNGRRVNIADYVRMVLRTTSTRAALQGKSERFKASGYDTVLVSSYGMCSKTCLPWQGRVYINDAFMDWQGETKYEGDVKYGRSEYCGKWFPLLSSAIAEGLFHPNCRHSINLYIDGVTDIPEPVDNEVDERRYKEEQHQRALEREVRKAKRKVEGSLDPADVKKAKAELQEAQKNVRDYINETNAAEGERVLVRKPIQEKIYGEAPPRIGSSADPYEPPKKPVQSSEGFAAEVSIPAPENQTVQYTEQKIPERLKSAGVEETSSESSPLKGSADIQFDRFDGSKAVRPELAEEYRAEYDKFTAVFGDLSSLNGIGVAPFNSDDDIYGRYFPESRSIIIYGAGGDKGEKFVLQTAQANKANGEWSTGSKYHSFRHELGHALQMEHRLYDTAWEKKLSEIENLRVSIITDLTNDDGSVRIEEEEKLLSKYGFKDTDEFISECVAEYAQNPKKARKTSKTVVNIILRKEI